jgi:sugar/nucleoside kinase (ribokinase family)
MAGYDVLTIGNAIVDIIARTEDDFLVGNGIIKGAMNLIDAERAELLYSRMGPAVEASGGSAGNTAAGVASLGGQSAYFGKVANDHLGRIFIHDIHAQGVAFDTKPLETTPPTARSMIFVTPDGERSMNTYLGACVELQPHDIEEDKVAAAKITYFEGYLWDPPLAKDAIRLASTIAHKNRRKMAMTLSDSFCVDRYRAEFLDLMRSKAVDIVFANEHELKSLYQTSDFDTALELLRADCELAAVTLSEKGSIIIRGSQTAQIDPVPVEHVVDTTGAGDLYAAGVLYGLTQGKPLADCGRLGSMAASICIAQIGPRPQENLAEAARQMGLL